MLIQVCSGEPGAQPPQWALIECQGSLEYADEEVRQSIRDIGMLQMGEQGAVQITIGYHQLEGKRLPLKKPYALIEKVEDESGCVQYQVKGVIRDKYLFKTRPTALISKPLASR